jgi:hypothetical protein
MRSGNRERWQSWEDDLLKAAKSKEGLSWIEVSQELRQQQCERSARQCRERWANHLAPVDGNPPVRGPWTEREDKLIVLGVKAFGAKFAKIKELFGPELQTRTELDIKNRYHRSILNRLRDDDNRLYLAPPTHAGRPKKGEAGIHAIIPLPPRRPRAPPPRPPTEHVWVNLAPPEGPRQIGR